MRSIRWSFTLLIAILLCTSCSIEKRMHRGGYYIQWHKRTPRTVDRAEKTKKPEAVDTTVIAEMPEDTLVQQPNITEETVADTTVAQEVKHPAKQEGEPKEKKQFEPVGVLSAKLLIPAFIIPLLNDQINNHKEVFALNVTVLLILSLCLILGIVSMIIYLRNPKAYRFNIWAILAILIPLVFFILIMSDAVDMF